MGWLTFFGFGSPSDLAEVEKKREAAKKRADDATARLKEALSELDRAIAVAASNDRD